MTRDQGLQAQRTTLAWTRTGVAGAVLAGVLLRGAIATGSAVAALASASGTLGAVAILALGSRVARPTRRLSGPGRPCDYRGLQAVTCIVLLVGLLTIAVLAVD